MRKQLEYKESSDSEMEFNKSRKFDFENTIFKNTEPTSNIDFNRLQNKKRRLTNLFYSIINYSSATLFEPESINYIFKYYGKILKEKYQTNSEFDNSMKNSLSCSRETNELKRHISLLKTDDPDSFIVMPLFSGIHTLSAVIRKQNDGLKFYAIDKFTTHFTSGLPKSPYATEFVIKKGMENKLIDDLNEKAFFVDTPDIFKTLREYSEKEYELKIKHREQKLFTCLYKEPEAGIKFAFATRNLTNDQFKKLRMNNQFSKNFRVKWDKDINATMEIHRRFLDKLKESNPDVNLSDLDAVFNNYAQNKIFRREYEKTSNLSKAINAAFPGSGESHVAKELNLDSIKQVPELWKIYAPILTPKENMDLFKVGYNTNILGTYSYVFTNYDLDRILKSVKDLGNKMPIVSTQANDYHSVVNTVVAYALFEMFINKNNKSLAQTKEEDYKWLNYKIDKAIQFGPYSDKAHFTRGIIKLNRGLVLKNESKTKESLEEIKEGIFSLNNAYKLKPDSVATKLFLMVALKNAGMTKEAEIFSNDIFKNKINIDSKLRLNINNKRAHFNCMTTEVATEIRKEMEKIKNISPLHNNRKLNLSLN